MTKAARSATRACLCGLALVAAGILGSVALAQTGLWTSAGPAGGSVYCLVPDPSHPQTLYACTLHGVYRSDDSGRSWRFAWQGAPDVRVQAIAVDPRGSGTVYAGTVTPSGVASVGIFKSTDGGQSWTDANAGLIDPIYGFAPIDVESLAIDPNHPDIVVVGTKLSEVFRSTDAGATWTARTSGGYDAQLETSSVQFDPSGSGRVYAASTAGLLLSTDGGATWTQFGDLSSSLYCLVLDPTTPATIYAGDVSGNGIFKSIDKGVHWGSINKGLPSSSGSLPQIVSLALDPAHPGTLFAGSYGNGVFQTTTAGSTWTASSAGMRSSFVASFALGPGGSTNILAGTFGGGVYQSADAGHTWTPTSSGLHLSRISGLAVDGSVEGTAYAAAFDGVYKTVDGGTAWQLASGGLPIDPVSTVVAKPGSPGTLFAGTLGGGLWKSVDGGATWSASAQGLADSYVSSLAFDPTNASVLYAGTAHPDSSSQRVYKSMDGGMTWTRTGLDGQNFTIDYIAVNPAQTSQVIAGSHGEAGYFQSLDAGKSWSTVALSSPCGLGNDAAFPPGGAVVYAATSTGVCQSGDAGKTWSVSPIGDAAGEVLLIDPANPSTVYVGAAPSASATNGGVFKSTDGGQTWAVLGTGLEGFSVSSLVLDSKAQILHAGVDGGSVAELVLAADRAPVEPPARTRQPRPITPR